MFFRHALEEEKGYVTKGRSQKGEIYEKFKKSDASDCIFVCLSFVCMW